LTSGKTTALVELAPADQWEDREYCNLNRDASLARNIAPETDAIPRGMAIPTIIYPAEKMKSSIA
jgi:hypothetical protein